MMLLTEGEATDQATPVPSAPFFNGRNKMPRVSLMGRNLLLLGYGEQDLSPKAGRAESKTDVPHAVTTTMLELMRS